MHIDDENKLNSILKTSWRCALDTTLCDTNHALARLSVLLVGGGEGDYPDKPNDLPQVNHTFVGEVRVAHLLSFLCCI
jgi:hypothetical protein